MEEATQEVPIIIKYLRKANLAKEQILFCSFKEADYMLNGLLSEQKKKEKKENYKYAIVSESKKDPCWVAYIEAYGFNFNVIDLSKSE